MLPGATAPERAQSSLIRYCPDDLGAAVTLPVGSYDYVASECGDLDAVAEAFAGAERALADSAGGFVRRVVSVLYARTAAPAEVAPWSARIVSAPDREAATLDVGRTLASAAELAALSELEFTRRLFLAFMGRASTPAEELEYGTLSRTLRIDRVLQSYDCPRQLKRLGLRTAPLNQGRFVFGLYEALLNRPIPQTDEMEARYWANELFLHRRTPQEVVRAFAEGAEFTDLRLSACSTSPSLCGGWLVDATYRAPLHRAPEPAARAYWSGELGAGRVTRAAFVNAVAASAEFGDRMTRLGL